MKSMVEAPASDQVLMQTVSKEPPSERSLIFAACHMNNAHDWATGVIHRVQKAVAHQWLRQLAAHLAPGPMSWAGYATGKATSG
jgi:hypothetical protein